jgi:RND family efflux transporter MFP subunit
MKFKRKIIIGFTVVLLGCIIALLSFSGRNAKADGDDQAQVTPAAVALVARKPLVQSVTLSGEFVPFQQVDVHAKVAGYIRKIYVDVGDRVKTGQTLAILEVPELSAQLQGASASVHRAKDGVRRAESDINRAKSLHEARHLDWTRLEQASQARPGLIAQQELDDAMAKDKEAEAQVSADEAALAEAQGALEVALADEKQYNALSDYTRIVAPFNGVITKRWVDTGALVQAGTNSNTQSLPVVSVAQTDLFRLTLPVPESAVPSIRLGSTVKVRVQALNRDFDGKVSRFADDVSQETRTMHTEVDVRNPGGALVAGMYAEVQLTLAEKTDVLTVPVEAVTRNGSDATVLLVGPGNRIDERRVTLGMEGSDRLQITSGLVEGDRVVIGSRSQFRPGEIVDPKPVSLRNTAQEF